MTLTEFLLARIAEDEAVARAATHYQLIYIESQSQAEEDHARRHDPARILAECEAKRAIVALWLQLDEPEKLLDRLIFPTARASLDAALRALALVYANHPDYDEEWRP